MGGIMPPEYHAAYGARYYADPAKRERRAELARARYRDPANQEKVQARLAVSAAVKSGQLVRQPCQDCGEQKSEAHHPDYSQPLLVEWLCRRHHMERHPRPRKPRNGRPALLTECKNGHPYDEANTYVLNGSRYCRACNRASAGRYKAKARGQ